MGTSATVADQLPTTARVDIPPDTLEGADPREAPLAAFRALRREVNAEFEARGLSRKGGATAVVRAALVCLAWLLSYAAVLWAGQVSVGLGLALTVPSALAFSVVVFSVMHDGSHGAFSEHRWLNDLARWTLILSGASAVSWRSEHVVGHHTHTNILGLDSDLESAGAIRYHPGQPLRPWHRFQNVYAWLLYTIVTFKWAWFEDFEDVATNRFQLNGGARLLHLFEVLLSKVCHVTLFFLIPSIWFGWAGAVAFYFLHFALVSVVATSVFVVAHLSDVQQMPMGRDGALADWGLFQVATTANFAPNSAVMTTLLGGLNHQIEHHLFPAVAHRHYRWLRPIVQRWAEEHGATYFEFPSFWAAIRGHGRYLSRMGKAQSTDLSA